VAQWKSRAMAWRVARVALAGAVMMSAGLVYLQAGHAAGTRADAARHVPLAAPSGDYVSSRGLAGPATRSSTTAGIPGITAA